MPTKLRAIPIDLRADIVVVLDPFLKNGMDPSTFQARWSPSIATVCIPDVGVLRMINGEKIIVSPFAGADEERLLHIILYDGISAILAQRGVPSRDRQQFAGHNQAMTDYSIPKREVMTAYARQL